MEKFEKKRGEQNLTERTNAFDALNDDLGKILDTLPKKTTGQEDTPEPSAQKEIALMKTSQLIEQLKNQDPVRTLRQEQFDLAENGTKRGRARLRAIDAEINAAQTYKDSLLQEVQSRLETKRAFLKKLEQEQFDLSTHPLDTRVPGAARDTVDTVRQRLNNIAQEIEATQRDIVSLESVVPVKLSPLQERREPSEPPKEHPKKEENPDPSEPPQEQTLETLRTQLDEAREAYITQDLKRDRKVSLLERAIGRRPKLDEFDQEHAQVLAKYKDVLRAYTSARRDEGNLAASPEALMSLMKELQVDEALQRENLRTEKKLESSKLARFQKNITASLEWYRKQSWQKKLLVGGGLTLGGAALGGIGVAAGISAARIALSFGTSATGFKGMFDAKTQKRRENDVSFQAKELYGDERRSPSVENGSDMLSQQEDLEQRIASINSFLKREIDTIDRTFQNQKRDRFWNNWGAVFAGASVAIVSRTLGEYLSGSSTNDVRPSGGAVQGAGQGPTLRGSNPNYLKELNKNLDGGSSVDLGGPVPEIPELNIEEDFKKSLQNMKLEPVVDDSIEPLPAPQEVSHTVKSGDNLWKILEGKLEKSTLQINGQSVQELIKSLPEGKQTFVIDYLKEAMQEKAGNSLDMLKVGQSLDLSAAFNDEILTKAFTEAGALSPEELASIDAQSDILEAYAKEHPDVTLTEEKIDQILNPQNYQEQWEVLPEAEKKELTSLMGKITKGIFDQNEFSSPPSEAKIMSVESILYTPADSMTQTYDNIRQFVLNAEKVLGHQTAALEPQNESVGRYVFRMVTEARRRGVLDQLTNLVIKS